MFHAAQKHASHFFIIGAHVNKKGGEDNLFVSPSRFNLLQSLQLVPVALCLLSTFLNCARIRKSRAPKKRGETRQVSSMQHLKKCRPSSFKKSQRRSIVSTIVQ